MPASNNPQVVRQQYLTDKSLRVRQEIHAKYTVPRIDFNEWVMDSYNYRGGEVILDVGSGSGTYHPLIQHRWPDVTYYGLDLSYGMLKNHSARTGLVLADAQRVPFPDDTFDLIMANHMMYHLPDIDEALVEFRRVLKPNGVLMTATNSAQSMPELQVLMRRAILLLTRTGGTQVKPPTPASELFALENGSRQLARHFFAIVRQDLPSKLVFSEIDPLMKYIESTRKMREPQLPKDVAWDDVMMIMRQQITHLVNHLGELVINKLSGVLLASDSGDFIQQFVEIRERV
jgi:SAM-dependent methyltransferase